MNILEKRKKVYKDFPVFNLNQNLSDIVLLYDINENDFLNLQESVKQFLLRSLSVYYKRDFIWTDNFLELNESLINELPNKTPNGILKPKKENLQEFINIQKSINSILKNLNIDTCIDKITIPNIRYKKPNESSETKTRPYYTGKFHSDAWVGHKGDSVFLIGVMGDIDNNTVEFYEPHGLFPNYLDKAESFEEGNQRYNSLDYLGFLSSKKLGVMDHACIHRTLIKENAGPRISIDMAVLVNSEHSHIYDGGFDESQFSYFDSNIIKEIGSIKKYITEDSFFDNNFSKIKIV